MAWSADTPQRFGDPRYATPLPAWTGAAVVVLVGGYAALFGWSMTHSSYDMWGGLIIGPALLVVSMPFLLRAARRDADVWIGQLLIAALVLKLVASLARYYVAFEVYDGYADALEYHNYGSLLHDEIRDGRLAVDVDASLVGTGFVRWLTAVIYAVTGPSLVGGYLVFAWIGYWGLYNFYRAFTITFPDSNRRRYALLLFLLPSMLFWPSGIGKDAWMLLTLGVTANGAARLLKQRQGGLALLVAGIGGQLLVRPHIAVLVVGALVVAYLIRRRPARLAALGPIKSALTWTALGLATLLVIGRVQSFFGADSFSTEAATTILSETERRTGQGGSAIEYQEMSQPTVTLDPLDLPWSIVTVLYRPFPFEAHNFQALLAAAEGLLLLALTMWAWRRLRTIPGRLRSDPYMTWCFCYVLLFCYAFGHILNFGILTRERVQVFPLVFVLLALPRGAPDERTQRP